MKQKRDHKTKYSDLDWRGFFILFLYIELNIYLFTMIITSFELYVVLFVMGMLALALVRGLSWKTILLTLIFVICFMHPIRILAHWWINPIIYGALVICLVIALVKMLKAQRVKVGFVIILFICSLHATRETFDSAREIGTCWLEDIRYTDYFYCPTSNHGYKQIQQSPLGMENWCTYCEWHER